jgi:dTDP-D-glucose 4,6-dehydratase
LNLGSEECFSLNQTAEIFLKLEPDGSAQNIPFPSDRKAIDIGDYQGDFSRIKEKLGWMPKTNFEEGMRKTIDYYKQFSEKYW